MCLSQILEYCFEYAWAYRWIKDNSVESRWNEQGHEIYETLNLADIAFEIALPNEIYSYLYSSSSSRSQSCPLT